MMPVKVHILLKRKGGTIPDIMSSIATLSAAPRKLVETVLLTLSFIIGIGITALILKVAGASPLKKPTTNSSWELTTGSNKNVAMY